MAQGREGRWAPRLQAGLGMTRSCKVRATAVGEPPAIRSAPAAALLSPAASSLLSGRRRIRSLPGEITAQLHAAQSQYHVSAITPPASTQA